MFTLRDLPLAEDVNLEIISRDYELTGGFIHNAVRIAIGLAVNRKEDKLVITQEDLKMACKQTLQGQISVTNFHRREIPSTSLADLVVSNEVKSHITNIVDYERSRKVLTSRWGFKKVSLRVLISGQRGTGKKVDSPQFLSFRANVLFVFQASYDSLLF